MSENIIPEDCIIYQKNLNNEINEGGIFYINTEVNMIVVPKSDSGKNLTNGQVGIRQKNGKVEFVIYTGKRWFEL